METEGKYGMWYVGSSALLERVNSVTDYNDIFINNVEEVNKSADMKLDWNCFKTTLVFSLTYVLCLTI